MSELLIRVADKINDDPYKDCKCLKRGDVVAVCADGWPWSVQELTAPYWRVLKLPNITETQVASFLGPEFDSDPQNPSRMLRRRAFAIDLVNAAIPTGVAAWLADDTRAQPTRTLTFTAAQFAALKKSKTPIADPNVLG